MTTRRVRVIDGYVYGFEETVEGGSTVPFGLNVLDGSALQKAVDWSHEADDDEGSADYHVGFTITGSRA